MKEIPKTYEPATIEQDIFRKWMDQKVYAAYPDQREERYVIMMPLPNVTGALHMGHAMDNVMQDLLTRWHRMMQHNTLWMPGTDHAGIATQAVVEKRLLELEGKTRHDVGREKLVEKIWEWKNEYQARIVAQQQKMGCSCDWDRQRFTMDAICARAVRETFFRLFRDNLIFRGYRLINWDVKLQTSVSDDELYYETVNGHFWHLRYPIVNPQPGEPDAVVVATTRPETMLGDTAVAVHPEPEKVLREKIAQTQERLAEASPKDREAIAAELERLEGRLESHLPTLKKLSEMAKAGRKVLLPLQNREIPLICDEWAKPELGSGCVKITPAHDPNDYEVWKRHETEIASVNILNPDGTFNPNAGAYAGLDRYDVRKKLVQDLDDLGLLVRVEDREVEVGHSDRSKSPIEPYLSKQWFVRMGDVPGGITMGRGTANQFEADGLAQAAINAAGGTWKTRTGRQVTFHPDPVRYRNTYVNWLSEKRDWCISRQLWWGHRIPIWMKETDAAGAKALAEQLSGWDTGIAWTWISDEKDERHSLKDAETLPPDGRYEFQVCLRGEELEGDLPEKLEKLGFAQDPDVLDTWFSSALWPHSTLGWPDPQSARVEAGQSATAANGDNPDTLSYYYPGSCLVTGRDIITLWVARMVIAGLYNLGDVPFTDVFIHATILDGKGERMSKSKGNGIDPNDIIEQYGADALRYVICDMQTGTQDIRLPVQAISPYTGNKVDLATAKHGRTIFTYIDPESGKEFDVLGTMKDIPAARVISDRFEIGKFFCNKLWNAARFAMMRLEGEDFRPLGEGDLALEDRWILSRLTRTVAEVQRQLENYNPSAAINAARDFFWSEFCDWYLELIKPRMKDAQSGPVARQVLAGVMDYVLRLFHPFIPYITDAIWELLNERAPRRGIDSELPGAALAALATWPAARPEWESAELESAFALMREVVRSIREVRNNYTVPPGNKVDVSVKAAGADKELLTETAFHIREMAGLSAFSVSENAQRPKHAASQVIGDMEVYVDGVMDVEKERQRIHQQIENLAKRIAGMAAKLANPSFVEKAPADIVDRTREQLEDLEGQQTLLEENLRNLED